MYVMEPGHVLVESAIMYVSLGDFRICAASLLINVLSVLGCRNLRSSPALGVGRVN